MPIEDWQFLPLYAIYYSQVFPFVYFKCLNSLGTAPAVNVGHACVLCASPHGPSVCLDSPSRGDLVVLNKVFVVRYYRIGCLYYGRCNINALYESVC